MHLWLAIKAFFGVLFNSQTAEKVQLALNAPATNPTAGETKSPAPKPAAAPQPSAAAAASKPKPARSEALTLLATLQREARLIDFLQEKLDGIEDAQIGAAVRDVHREAAATLERLFALQPLSSEREGQAVEIPVGFDPARFQLSGNVTGQPPFRGQLVHHGWQATRCELPVWSGSDAATKIVAPAEVELK